MTTYLDNPTLAHEGTEEPLPAPPPRSRTTARLDWAHDHETLLEVLVVGSIVAVAAALRLWSLGRIGLRGDESVYAGQAAILAGHHDFSRHFILASRGNSNFLIFQGILSIVYRIFGVGDVSARALSATLSVLTVPLVYLIGRMLGGRRAAVCAAALVAISAYSVALGRLALLDAAATFFITAAILFLVLWQRRGSVVWLALFTLTTGIAAETKVTSILLVAVFGVVVVADKSWRRLGLRTVLIAAAAGLVALTPAIIEVAGRAGTLSSFLGTSVHRNSPVVWTYYFRTLWDYSGAPFLILAGIGLIAVIVKPRRNDLVPWLWLGIFAVFLMVYPLKAFNYLLPLVPAMALLAGRGLATIRLPKVPRPAIAFALILAAAVGSIPFLAPSRHDDASVGMREASFWLQDNVPSTAGVMTLSHGSAQYVMSFYSGIDAFPFGRFRLATVVPGGDVVSSKPTASGKLPLDWISKWPPRLLHNHTVSYFVYSTDTLDDTIEGSGASKSLTQRQFRSFIESYGGQLIHTVYVGNRPRAFIYKATKTDPKPEVRYSLVNRKVQVSAKGFAPDSHVVLRYHGETIDEGTTNHRGEMTFGPIPTPSPTQSRYYFAVSDELGNDASANGLPSASLSYLEANGWLELYGQGFAPGSRVVISYHGHQIGVTTAGSNGSLRTAIAYPASSRPRYQLRATDSTNKTAWVTGVPAPSLRVSVSHGRVRAIGQYFVGAGKVTVTYHGKVVAQPKTVGGAFDVTFPLPSPLRARYELIAIDQIGRRVRLTGLGPNGITARSQPGGNP